MGETSIEWTDKVWNPLRGCTRVSPGCTNCYAERLAARFAGEGLAFEGLAKNTPSGPRWTGEIRLVEEHLEDPLRWRKPVRVFVNSVSDLFHEKVPFEYIDRVFAVMALAQQHTFQVLTKRPERMLEYFQRERVDRTIWRTARPMWEGAGRGDIYERLPVPVPCGGPEGLGIRDWPLPNVWLGVSVEDQETADKRIPLLLQCPAVVRWVSAEPLLGPLDVRQWLGSILTDQLPSYGPNQEWPVTPGISWIVAGGESGPGARPMHPDWARSLRDQCEAAGVSFHFKQWGQFGPCPWVGLGTCPQCGGEHGRIIPGRYDSLPIVSLGKKQAGRELDGRTHDAFPIIPA